MKTVRPYIKALLDRGGVLPKWSIALRGDEWIVRKDRRIVVQWNERDSPPPHFGFIVKVLVDTLAVAAPIAEVATRKYQKNKANLDNNRAEAARERENNGRAAGMQDIRACIARGEAPEEYVHQWAALRCVHPSTVYRWIVKVRAES